MVHEIHTHTIREQKVRGVSRGPGVAQVLGQEAQIGGSLSVRGVTGATELERDPWDTVAKEVMTRQV